MSDIIELSARELLGAYSAGELRPSEVVAAYLSRIGQVEPVVGAFLTIEAERALQLGSEADKRCNQGRMRPLEGIPYASKDIVDTRGVRTTGGSYLYQDYLPDESAAVISRFDAAGSIRLGKLQTFEFAIGANDATRNPWNPERWPAGSSSGSAAAIAAREALLTIGTDTGGSIAIPASMCGVAGLKPTYGRIPRTGVMPLSWTLDHVGFFARHASDIELALSAAAGPDGLDPTCLTGSDDEYQCDVEVDKLRVGVPEEWFLDLCHPDIDAAYRDSLNLLAGQGATINSVHLPTLKTIDPLALERTIIMGELASLHKDHLIRLSEYGPEFAKLLIRSQFVLAADYLSALRVRNLLQRDFEQAFEMCDVIVVPPVTYLVPLMRDLTADFGEFEMPLADVVARNTSIFNLLGAPTTTVRAGLDSNRMPIGIQVAARPRQDGLSLAVAAVIQSLVVSESPNEAALIANKPMDTARDVLLPIRNRSEDALW